MLKPRLVKIRPRRDMAALKRSRMGTVLRDAETASGGLEQLRRCVEKLAERAGKHGDTEICNILMNAECDIALAVKALENLPSWYERYKKPQEDKEEFDKIAMQVIAEKQDLLKKLANS